MNLRRLSMAAALLVASVPSKAEIIQVPAVAFDQEAAASNGGVLWGATRAAPINFPRPIGEICALSVVYVDVDDADIFVRLYKKRIAPGTSPEANQTLLARIRTVGPPRSTVRKATTQDILDGSVNLSTAFYYVQVHMQPEEPMTQAILGVQLDFRDNCNGQP